MRYEKEGFTLVSIQNILFVADITNNDLDILGLEFFIDEFFLFTACGRRRSQDCDAIKLPSSRDDGSNDVAANVSGGPD